MILYVALLILRSICRPSDDCVCHDYMCLLYTMMVCVCMMTCLWWLYTCLSGLYVSLVYHHYIRVYKDYIHVYQDYMCLLFTIMNCVSFDRDGICLFWPWWYVSLLTVRSIRGFLAMLGPSLSAHIGQMQKSPIFYQKSPIIYQKSPAVCEKSHVIYERSPEVYEHVSYTQEPSI